VAEQLLYRPERAGGLLDVSRTKIFSLMRSGELRSVKIGKSRRIPASALAEYVAKLEQSQGDGAPQPLSDGNAEGCD
jgi:excisionase family DNA binding protein